jgi:putative DNA methylase
MAIVAEGDRGRVDLPPLPMIESIAQQATPDWKPDVEFFQQALGFRVGNYGMTKWSDLFTSRQLVALSTFSDLVIRAQDRILRDAREAGTSENGPGIAADGAGANAYAQVVRVYLAFAVSKMADMCNSICAWGPTDLRVRHLFARQAIPMTWDYAETNPLADAAGGFEFGSRYVAKVLEGFVRPKHDGSSMQADAQTVDVESRVVSTDPPYYDNVGYADLSDFFYVWLRRALKDVFPELFATVAVPKAQELVATPDRHGGKEQAEAFFLEGMSVAFHRFAERAHPAFPVTIYYAFKQADSDGLEGTASTGWETFLDAVIRAGFATSGTWPLRTELANRMRGMDSNALASSIILVCRPRPASAPIATRREFLTALKDQLPDALAHLQRGNIAPVDLAQAAIGPGMAVYTRYAKVIDAEGKALSVRDALALINQTLDEVQAEQEGDFDADTRWALSWFEQAGFEAGEYGVAETLSKAKNTSVQGMKDAGILDKKSPGGKVRLLRPSELPDDWDPIRDPRLTVWEVVHHIIRRLESGGEVAAAELVSVLGGVAEVARELAYRLYTICERKKRAPEALAYNALVQSWPEIIRLAREEQAPKASQTQMFQQV